MSEEINNKTDHFGYLVGELLTNKFEKPKEFWGPVITEGSLTMLYAKPGIGKSFLAYKILHAIVTGEKFLKWKGCGDEKGALFEGEMGPAQLAERFSKIDNGSSVQCMGGAIRVVTYKDCDNNDELWNMSDPGGQRMYERAAITRRVIIIDNLVTAARAMPGVRDDDASIWGRIQPWLVKLRDQGVAVILVHHAGKSGSQLGTSMREIIMDSVIELTDIPRQRKEDRLKFDLHFKKARRFYGEDAESLRVEMFTGHDGGFLWEWYPRYEARNRDVARYLRMGWSSRKIAVEMGMQDYEVIDAIEEVKKQGLLHEDEF